MTRHPLRVLLLVPLLLCSAFTTERPPTVDELVQGASRVIEGRVVAQASHWDRAHKLILTDTTFSVDKWLKGAGGPTLTVTEVGGSVDGTTLMNPARATFAHERAYVVFLVERETGGVRTYFGPYGRLDASELPIVVSRMGAAGVRP